mmetsp:Transcript_116326/g.173793  ORF Transcript_116326/g.173793 Transcript_116326/m.173793 type:complete len:243 (+) Transcript_116326:1-729(+)
MKCGCIQKINAIYINQDYPSLELTVDPGAVIMSRGQSCCLASWAGKSIGSSSSSTSSKRFFSRIIELIDRRRIFRASDTLEQTNVDIAASGGRVWFCSADNRLAEFFSSSPHGRLHSRKYESIQHIVFVFSQEHDRRTDFGTQYRLSFHARRRCCSFLWLLTARRTKGTFGPIVVFLIRRASAHTTHLPSHDGIQNLLAPTGRTKTTRSVKRPRIIVVNKDITGTLLHSTRRRKVKADIIQG